ncbi:MAG: chemotaxis protein CheD [Rubrivivax sp.]
MTTLAAPPVLTVLHPGDVACVGRGDRLETLLGSCVAVVLTDPRRSVGAMCHVVHARASERTGAKPGCYADPALDIMAQLLRARGIEPRLCEAYVYGGSNMFPGVFTQRHVGDDNVRRVLQRLAEDGIAVRLQDHGGTHYRRVGWTVGQALPEVRTASSKA